MTNIAEEVFARGKGKVESLQARVRGLHGVFLQLAEEHGEVSALIAKVSRRSDAETARRLFPRIRMELLAHERAEMEVIYERLSRHEASQRLVRQHAGQASEIEELLVTLSQGDPGSASWWPIFERLKFAVQRHAEAEESEYFQEAERVLGVQESNDLKQSYLDRKQAITAALR